jgi:hypothetical protein
MPAGGAYFASQRVVVGRDIETGTCITDGQATAVGEVCHWWLWLNSFQYRSGTVHGITTVDVSPQHKAFTVIGWCLWHRTY